MKQNKKSIIVQLVQYFAPRTSVKEIEAKNKQLIEAAKSSEQAALTFTLCEVKPVAPEYAQTREKVIEYLKTAKKQEWKLLCQVANDLRKKEIITPDDEHTALEILQNCGFQFRYDDRNPPVYWMKIDI